jgi:hypothetical protein
VTSLSEHGFRDLVQCGRDEKENLQWVQFLHLWSFEGFSCNHSFYGFHSFGICCCAGSLWLLGVRWRSTWHLCYMPDWVVVHPPWEQWICELYKTHILCLGFHSSQAGWLIPGFNNSLIGYQSEGAWSVFFCCGVNICLTCLICLFSANTWNILLKIPAYYIELNFLAVFLSRGLNLSKNVEYTT